MIDIIKPETVGLSSNRLGRVTTWLEQQVASKRVAGCSALIGRRGGVAYFETAGQADIAQNKPFTRDTIVRIYSMTKPVTSVAAMMLYEEGAFQLDDPVARYIPEFGDLCVWAGGEAGIEHTVPVTTPMTVRHLMTHTSGLTYGFMQTNPVDERYREAGIEFPGDAGTLEELVRRLAEIPLLCQPGSEWNYSVSTDVLGRLVEIWSGESLEAFFASRIFEPLDMRDAGFFVQPDNHARFAALYAPKNGPSLGSAAQARTDASAPVRTSEGLELREPSNKSSFLAPTELFSGGGGLTASMRDYARFCQMLLRGGELDGARVLGRKTVGYMRTNQLPNDCDMAAMGQPMWSETNYEGIGFGLGFAVVLDPVKAHIITSVGEHHWGGAASTFFWLDPVEDLFVVFYTQLIPSSTYPIRRELRTRVYQAIVDSL